MNGKLKRLVTTRYIIVARSFVTILGCIAVGWGIARISVYLQDFSVEQVATQIIAGDPFKAETLAQLVPFLDNIKKSPYCRPAALSSTAIVEFRRVEVATANNSRGHLAVRLKSLSNVIRRSLSCAPADPFLWLALYSVEVHRNGFKPVYLKYLRLSYQLGPQEGWIVLKRNPLAFEEFQRLPQDLREDAINEFVSMLREYDLFGEQAVNIFIGPAWRERDLILLHLKRLSAADRQQFADLLRKRGYDLSTPGIGPAPVDPHRFAPLIRVPR
jgi:hypothetical protein